MMQKTYSGFMLRTVLGTSPLSDLANSHRHIHYFQSIVAILKLQHT